MSFFLSVPRELNVLIVEYLSVPDALKFASTCHFLHDNPPFDPELLGLLKLVDTTRSINSPEEMGMTSLHAVVDKLISLESESFLRRLFLHPSVSLSSEDIDTITCSLQEAACTRHNEVMLLSEDFYHPVLHFAVELCEKYKDIDDGDAMECVKSMIIDALHTIVNTVPFDEDLYYRALHVHWHNETDESKIPQVVNLEKFIHLAIATDHVYDYIELKSRRGKTFCLANYKYRTMPDGNFTTGQKRVTDQDVYSVIRYDSRDIFMHLRLDSTDVLRGILEASGRCCTIERADQESDGYNKACGICKGVGTLREMYQERLERMLSMESYLS